MRVTDTAESGRLLNLKNVMSPHTELPTLHFE